MQHSFSVIGLMSGSSLDGIDLVHVTFIENEKGWQFDLRHTACIVYDDEMRDRLNIATSLSGIKLWQLHSDLGHYFGKKIAAFISEKNIGKVDFVASHGHTVFHYPDLKFTTQIGDGAALAGSSKQKVICDFRTSDIAHDGQGAPIVPIGEKHLFPEFKLFVNIGGIANISAHTENGVVAYDCCVANQVLNYFAQQKGIEYDEGGNIAASGNINQKLLSELNALEYHKQPFPKSLDNGYAKEIVLPLIKNNNLSIEDTLATGNEFIAVQISNALNSSLADKNKVMITGGGAFNLDLIKRIEEKTMHHIFIPDENIVKYKEALIIAFMGVLRIQGKMNVLSDVTGATKNTINGAIYES
jgi:anhydro-N-acetylmuramic acid kinase